MPIYEYECASCKKRIEIMQKINDPPLEKCEHCSGKLSRLISPAGLVFKGSGWYVTDYSDKMKKPADESKPSSSDSSKGDSKAKESGGSGEGSKKKEPQSASNTTSSPKKDSPSK